MQNIKLSFFSIHQQAYAGQTKQHGPDSESPQMAAMTSPMKWGCLSPRVPGWINGDNVLEGTSKNTECNSNGLWIVLC